jgi:hypothetical protein
MQDWLTPIALSQVHFVSWNLHIFYSSWNAGWDGYICSVASHCQINKNKHVLFNSCQCSGSLSDSCAMTVLSLEFPGDTLPSPPSTQPPSVPQESSSEPTEPPEEHVRRHAQFYLGDVVPPDVVILQVWTYCTPEFLWWSNFVLDWQDIISIIKICPSSKCQIFCRFAQPPTRCK